MLVLILSEFVEILSERAPIHVMIVEIYVLFKSMGLEFDKPLIFIVLMLSVLVEIFAELMLMLDI